MLAIVSIACVQVHAQKTKSQSNFFEIRKKFYSDYEKFEKQGLVPKPAKEADGILENFHRWEWMMQTRAYPNGNLPDPSIQFREWQKQQAADMLTASAPAALWSQVGNNIVPTQGGGAGRINVVRIDPNNSNVMYIATAGGGVWKTTNGGSTWACLTDKLPVTSMADVAIDPSNSNSIYVATGDGSGYEFNNDFWGGVYTAGVLHSGDGGTTWSPAFPDIPQSQQNIIQRLVISPFDKKILIGATRDGLYRTTDGGATIKKVSSAHCYDIEWKPGDANTVYAGGDGVLYRSADKGATWTAVKTGVGSSRMSIEVCAASPNTVYAIGVGSGFFRSDDGGTTWTAKTYPSGAGFYGYYDLAFCCSQSNANALLAGGLNTVKSTDGGVSWTAADNWSSYTAPNYVHADKHGFAFLPGSASTAFAVTDGGIFKTANGGTSWTDLSNGLMIAQPYRLGTTPQNTNLYISGWQDNGCNLWNGTSWTRVYGADGMEAAIDYSNQNTMYEEYQYGGLQRSLDGGVSWTYIAPSSGDWLVPFIQDPVVSTRLYYGTFSLYKTDNRGTNWSVVSGLSFPGYIESIAVAPSNNNIIYAASFTKIMRKDLGTNTSTDITAGLPVAQTQINYIAVSNTDPNKVWVALSTYSAGNKVYKSTNGGSTWTNVSGNLPNLPVNTIVYQNGSNDRVYAGTDIGVYYIDNTLTNWKFYSSGLPNVMVHELEINYTSNKLVAATYGRGLWQVDLVTPSPAAGAAVNKSVISNPSIEASVSPNPTTGWVTVQVNNITKPVILGVYKLEGERMMTYKYSVDQAKSIRLNLSNLPDDNYIIRIQSGDMVTSKQVEVRK